MTRTIVDLVCLNSSMDSKKSKFFFDLFSLGRPKTPIASAGDSILQYLSLSLDHTSQAKMLHKHGTDTSWPLQRRPLLSSFSIKICTADTSGPHLVWSPQDAWDLCLGLQSLVSRSTKTTGKMTIKTRCHLPSASAMMMLESYHVLLFPVTCKSDWDQHCKRRHRDDFCQSPHFPIDRDETAKFVNSNRSVFTLPRIAQAIVMLSTDLQLWLWWCRVLARVNMMNILRIAKAIATVLWAWKSDHDKTVKLGKATAVFFFRQLRNAISRWIVHELRKQLPQSASSRRAIMNHGHVSQVQLQCKLQTCSKASALHLAKSPDWRKKVSKTNHKRLRWDTGIQHCKISKNATATGHASCISNCDGSGQLGQQQPVKKNWALNQTWQSTICWPLLPVQDI